MPIFISESSAVYQKYKMCHTDSTIMTYKRLFDVIQFSARTTEQFIEIFKQCPFEQYYFEVKPINIKNINTTQFEFVLYAATGLFNKAKYDKFEEYGINQSNNRIKHFMNPSKNTLLIVPTYNKKCDIHTYAHIANFMRYGNNKQQHNLLKKMFKYYEKELNKTTNQLWLSTSGKGVPWLHIRIDQIPKYITFDEYK